MIANRVRVVAGLTADARENGGDNKTVGPGAVGSSVTRGLTPARRG